MSSIPDKDFFNDAACDVLHVHGKKIIFLNDSDMSTFIEAIAYELKQYYKLGRKDAFNERRPTPRAVDGRVQRGKKAKVKNPPATNA